MSKYQRRVKILEDKILEKFGDEEGFQRWLDEHPLSTYGSYLNLHNICPYEYKGKVMKLYLNELSLERSSNGEKK